MTIIFYDGSTLECTTVEPSASGKHLILDEADVIDLKGVIRITD